MELSLARSLLLIARDYAYSKTPIMDTNMIPETVALVYDCVMNDKKGMKAREESKTPKGKQSDSTRLSDFPFFFVSVSKFLENVKPSFPLRSLLGLCACPLRTFVFTQLF